MKRIITLLIGLLLLAASVRAQQVTSFPPASLPLSGAEQIYVVQGGYGRQTTTGAILGGSAGPIVWPTIGDLILSNGTQSPGGLAPVNGDCVLGAGGVWVAGSCGVGSVTSITTNNCLTSTPTNPITSTGTVALTLVPVEPAASVSGYTVPSSSACTVTFFKNTASNITVTLAPISTTGFTSGSAFGIASAAGSGGLTVQSTSYIGTGTATIWPIAAGTNCWFVSGATGWIPLCGSGGGGGANTWITTTITNTAGQTIPASALLPGRVIRTGPTAADVVDTLDTPANVYAAYVAAGGSIPSTGYPSWQIYWANTSQWNDTLTWPTGVTSADGNTTKIFPPNTSGILTIILTSNSTYEVNPSGNEYSATAAPQFSLLANNQFAGAQRYSTSPQIASIRLSSNVGGTLIATPPSSASAIGDFTNSGTGPLAFAGCSLWMSSVDSGYGGSYIHHTIPCTGNIVLTGYVSSGTGSSTAGNVLTVLSGAIPTTGFNLIANTGGTVFTPMVVGTCTGSIPAATCTMVNPHSTTSVSQTIPATSTTAGMPMLAYPAPTCSGCGTGAVLSGSNEEWGILLGTSPSASWTVTLPSSHRVDELVIHCTASDDSATTTAESASFGSTAATLQAATFYPPTTADVVNHLMRGSCASGF